MDDGDASATCTHRQARPAAFARGQADTPGRRLGRAALGQRFRSRRRPGQGRRDTRRSHKVALASMSRLSRRVTDHIRSKRDLTLERPGDQPQDLPPAALLLVVDPGDPLAEQGVALLVVNAGSARVLAASGNRSRRGAAVDGPRDAVAGWRHAAAVVRGGPAEGGEQVPPREGPSRDADLRQGLGRAGPKRKAGFGREVK
jgi:hypothetical protein